MEIKMSKIPTPNYKYMLLADAINTLGSMGAEDKEIVWLIDKGPTATINDIAHIEYLCHLRNEKLENER